jgi:hypothetical protein
LKLDSSSNQSLYQQSYLKSIANAGIVLGILENIVIASSNKNVSLNTIKRSKFTEIW